MKSTLFTLSNATVNAINEMNATCNSCRTRVFQNCVMIYGNVTFADGHKSFINTQGKDMDTAEKNFLRCVIKRAVPKAMFEETCAKYNITPDAFNRKAKVEVQVEAKADIQVEAKTEVVVEKQAPAAVVVEIPRLETVRQSRSPKKLKAQKLAESTENKVIVEIGAKVEEAATEAPTSLPGIPMAIGKAKRKMYELVMQNLRTVGNKRFAFIPLELLFADYRFQRIHKKGSRKVRRLIERWVNAKCDPLRVSPHNEECMFSIIDGYHRFLAASALGMEGIVCEVLEVPEDKDERLKLEATLFATQNDELDKLAPVEKHYANLIIGSEKHIILDNLLHKYGIELKINTSGGKVKAGSLAGYVYALEIAKSHGETVLDDVFNIICNSRWNIANHGLSNDAISCIKNVLTLHPDRRDDIVSEAAKMLKLITPDQLFAESFAAYPNRTESERPTLYLEDKLCDTLGMERVYLANKGIERHSTVNAEIQVGVSAS